MGILDLFKKTNNEHDDKEKESVDSIESRDIESADYEEIDIHMDEIDTLTGERCNELISHVLKDRDFGEEVVRKSNIRENIFITVYMRNTLLKQFEGDEVSDLHNRFLDTIERFEDILFEKIMKLDKVWKVINKATGSPVIDNDEEHILISDMYKDNMIEQFKKLGVIAEAVELNHEQFVNELSDLYRTGYKGMRFTDGRQAPCVFKRERMLDPEKVQQSENPVNPETYFALTAYLQEFRRSTNHTEENKILNVLGRAMMMNIMKAKFIIPVQEVAENQFNLPIYRAGKNEKDEVTAIGLYVFTDEVEMKKLKLTGLNLDDGWKVQVNEFKDIIDKVEGCHISEICINFASTQFRLDANTINSLKKDAGITSKEDEIKKRQEEFEEKELPKILDKNVKVVRAPNEMPVFMREENRVCINNYIINTLERKNMFSDVMNSFFEDESVKVVKIYDVQTRNADIIIRDEGQKKGLFVMPMRYDGEDDSKPVNDSTIYYSENAAKVSAENSDQNGKYELAEKSMHFFTIVNSGNKSTYLPLFKDIEEAKKIFADNMFRYCMVTYDDILEKVKPYDGVVIGPTTLSTIIPKEFVKKIYDINM